MPTAVLVALRVDSVHAVSLRNRFQEISFAEFELDELESIIGSQIAVGGVLVPREVTRAAAR